MLTRLTLVAVCLALVCPCGFAQQGSISHIVVIIKENRSFDEMFGACAASAAGPIANLTGFSSSSPTGACNTTLSSSCPTGTVSLLHANPSLPDGYDSDLPHTRQAIVDSIDDTPPKMDGFGGICSDHRRVSNIAGGTTFASPEHALSLGRKEPRVVTLTLVAPIYGSMTR